MQLYIDGATQNLTLALINKNVIINKIMRVGNNNHTTNLYEIFDELKVDFKEISEIVVINGPGSYTGLRVAMIFAKTIAMSCDIKIRPLNYLSAVASYETHDFVIDARGQKFFKLVDQKVVLVTKDEIGDAIINPIIDLDLLVRSQIIDLLTPLSYKEIKIDYCKEAL